MSIRLKVFLLTIGLGLFFLGVESVILNRLLNEHMLNMAGNQNISFIKGLANDFTQFSGNDYFNEMDGLSTRLKKLLEYHPALKGVFFVDSEGRVTAEANFIKEAETLAPRLVGSRQSRLIQTSEQDHWAFSMPIIKQDQYRGSLVAILHLEQLAQDLRAVQVTVLWIGSAFWVVLIAILLTSFYYLILRRVHRLSGVALELAAGHLEKRADPESQDEVGAMAVSFNVMADSLTRSISSLDYEKSRLQTILDTQSEYLFTVDANRRITMVNRRVTELLGPLAKEIIGRECTTLIDAQDCRLSCHLLESAEGCHSIKDIEAQVQLPGGGSLPVRKNATVMRDEAGRLIGAVETFRDIRGEKELARLKTEWDSFIRHEIKSPLNPIIGFSDLLVNMSDDLDGSTIREYHRIIHESALNLNHILNMTREVQAYEAGQIDLNVISQDIMETVNAALREAENALKGDQPERCFLSKIEIVPGTSTIITHDPQKMQRVFKNLIKNAWEHHDGEVTVTIDGDESFIRVAIHNFGDPIPSDKLATIFEKFNTTKKAQGGMGLGTTIARLFTMAHGGDIQATSSTEKGTAFTVRLARKRAINNWEEPLEPSSGNTCAGMLDHGRG